MKICSNIPGHMTMPIIVKNFKILILQNQETDGIETWYTASGTLILPIV